MADFATRRTTMVDTQVRPSDVTKFPIIEAMLSIEREKFVLESQIEAAYAGLVLDVGGREMMEPRDFAKLLDGLNVGPTDMVLDIGCGLGYSTAVIAHMAEAVVAVEEGADLAESAQRILSENGVDNAAVLDGPLNEGAAKHGPYDVIVIEGAVEQLPVLLLDQVKEGGRIGAVFQDGALGTVRIGQKIDGTVNWRSDFNASVSVLNGFQREMEFEL